MDKFNDIVMFFVMPVMVVTIIIMLGLTFIEINIQNERVRQSCKDIGMEYHYAMDTTFCVDSLGNAHYTKFKCEGFLWNKECKAQLISIGDVRVR